MSQIRFMNHDSFDAVEDTWSRLSQEADYFYPSFAETKERLLSDPANFQVAASVDAQDKILGFACFAFKRGRQTFSVGRRRLFSLPAREIQSVGFNGLGDWTSSAWEELLLALMRRKKFNLVSLGEVPLTSPLTSALRRLPRAYAVGRTARKPSIRWFVDFPDTFEAYLAGLRPSTRKSVTYKLRRFDRELDYTLKVFTRHDQLDEYLRDGEAISRKTYQWEIGQRLENNAEFSGFYERMIERGAMRCYIVYVNGQPISFLRGELQNGVFHYETPGYDPSFEKHSPGLVLLLLVIKDLIEFKCRTFDFGGGGDLQGYKARFGNRSLECESLQVYPISNPYSFAIYSLHSFLSFIKNSAAGVLNG